MKLIIAGSRTFNNYELLKNEVTKYLSDLNTTEVSIICGMAKGADLLGVRYAREENLEIIKMPANWDKYKKSAGYVRNSEMGNIADAAIIFWDESSHGSKNMLNIMQKLNKPCKVVLF